MTSHTVVSELDKLCKKLYDTAFIFKPTGPTISCNDIVSDIFKLLQSIKTRSTDMFELSVPEVVKITTIYVSLGKMLYTKTCLYYDDAEPTLSKKICLADYFEEIKKNDCHNAKVGKECYTCSYHLESLFTHLHIACLTTLAYVITKKTDVSTMELIKYAAIALLHDIGKPGSLTLIKSKKWTSFPFHGELGSGLLLRLWNNNFGEPFTKIVWEEICRTVCVHMCGYHDHDPNDIDTQYKWNLLTTEHPVVKENLLYLSVGDYFGAIRDDSVSCVNKETFLKSRDEFLKYIRHTANTDTFFKSNNFIADKIIIFVRGSSGSGKTTCINKISSYLDRHCNKITVTKDDKDEQIKIQIKKGLEESKILLIDAPIIFDKFDKLFPEIIKSYLVISVYVIKNIKCAPVGRKDNPDNGKLKLIENKHKIMSWIQETTTMHLSDLSSISTARHNRDISISRPKICFVVSWNKYGDIGYDELYRQLKYFTYTETKLHTNMNIIEYSNELFQTTGWKEMINTFKKNNFLVSVPPQFKGTPYENRIIKIKYIENNKLWKFKWARQCRGVILYLADDNKIIALKHQLNRGAELLTQSHIDDKITKTQDVIYTPEHIELLDDNQQKIIKQILNNDDIEGILSFKSDGSLLAITYYFGEYAVLVKNWIVSFGDDFAKTVLSHSEKFGSVCVISSQNTFFLGTDMQSYVITSIIGAHNVHIDNTKSYNDIFKEHGMIFFEELNKFKDQIVLYTDAVNVTINFEAMCKDRTTAWLETHTELAISYPKSTINFLGISYCSENNIKYVPHFDIINPTIFKEPLWWKINHSKDITNLMNELENCILGSSTQHDFLERYVPNNKIIYPDVVLDYEGFVFFTKINGYEYDYNKIKSKTYYKAHKFKLQNVEHLTKIADTCGNIFPLAKFTKSFFEGLYNNLYTSLDCIIVELDKSQSKNEIYEMLDKNAKKTYAIKSQEVKYRMLINASKKFEEIGYNIFSKYFPALSNSEKIQKSEIFSIIKKITLEYLLLKGSDEQKNYLKESINNAEIKKLIKLCMGSIIMDVYF